MQSTQGWEVMLRIYPNNKERQRREAVQGFKRFALQRNDAWLDTANIERTGSCCWVPEKVPCVISNLSDQSAQNRL